ncbi:transposase, partial [Rhizobium hidalgonense]|nr:transposase [Rhizobium hidalgonense]
MRKVSMATRAELVAAISCRYVLGGRAEKARMLDEFVALTGFHRKHAMRLLRGEREPSKGGPRPGRRVYGDQVRAALVVVWEASDRICGKRLHPLLPTLIEAMERHGHGDMNSETRRQLLTMSPATIDRVLKEIKASATGPRRRKGSTAIRRSVPVRTFSDWDDPAPGFVEADLVSHSGPYARGAFSQTLVLTDIAT